MEIRSLNALFSLDVNSLKSTSKSTSESTSKLAPKSASRKREDDVSKAVVNDKISAGYVKGELEDRDIVDVRATNYEASEAEVRDVEEIAKIANKVTLNIANSKNALDAQANQLKEKVQSLLG